MGIKLGWKVAILFVLSYVIFWGFFMELGLAIILPIIYLYIETRLKQSPKNTRNY